MGSAASTECSAVSSTSYRTKVVAKVIGPKENLNCSSSTKRSLSLRAFNRLVSLIIRALVFAADLRLKSHYQN